MRRLSLAIAMRRLPVALALLLPAAGLLLGGTTTRAQEAASAPADPRITWVFDGEDPDGQPLRRGRFQVHEDRESRSGRTLELDFIVLPATGPDPRPDPVFYFAGGPGQAATSVAGGFRGSWMREERDLVFMDQRGTAGGHRLGCALPANDGNLQGYLAPIFQEEPFRRCLETLQATADLTKYTTPIAMDDYNELREALGYEQINIYGGSYGTRACLVYMRRHPETVRTAALNGVAPISFTNPLYHASEAQAGLETLFQEVEGNREYRKAFPDLREKFWEVMARLNAEPVEVEVRHPATGEPATVVLDRPAFAEALRVLLYYMGTNRQVPLLIQKAWEGDYAAFANAGIRSNRRLRQILAFGMLLCVTCAEDIPRIDPESIPEITGDTFLGDDRVRQQMAVCAFWPRGEVPEDYGEPVSVEVPVLVLSGTHDPVTSPKQGAAAARHLPNSLHVVVPGAHGVGGPCVSSIHRRFLETASVKKLDLSCVDGMKLPPLALPAGAGGGR